MITFAVVLSLLLSFGLAAAPVANAAVVLADDSNYSVNFEGMGFVAPSSDEQIKVTVDGLNEYKYTIKADVGRINGSSSTQSGNTEDGSFTFRYTSTTALSTNTITVTISSDALEEDITATYFIKVMDVYKISMNVKNTGNMALEDLPVKLFIDGNLYRTNEFDIPLSTEEAEFTTLTFNVDPSALRSGTHTYEIVFDESAQGLISFGSGENSATGTFYTGDGGWGILSIVLVIIVIVMFILLILTYFRSGKKKRKK